MMEDNNQIQINNIVKKKIIKFKMEAKKKNLKIINRKTNIKLMLKLIKHIIAMISKFFKIKTKELIVFFRCPSVGKTLSEIKLIKTST